MLPWRPNGLFAFSFITYLVSYIVCWFLRRPQPSSRSFSRIFFPSVLHFPSLFFVALSLDSLYWGGVVVVNGSPPFLPSLSLSPCHYKHTSIPDSRGDKQTLAPDHQTHSRSLTSTLLELNEDMSDVQAVEEALAVFSRAPDKHQLERANRWLQDFQHSVNTTFSLCAASHPTV
jgi:hypothetical protein